MPAGGARPGAGRPPGSIPKTVRSDVKKANESLVMPNRQLTNVAAGLKDPLKILLAFAASPEIPVATRVDAAKSAAPYIHPRLGYTETKELTDAKQPETYSRSKLLAIATSGGKAAAGKGRGKG